MSVALARQGNEVASIGRQLADIEREIGRGVLGAGGMPDAYLVERMSYLTQERARLTADLGEIAALAGDELTERFCPPAPEVEVINLEEALRGENVPRQVVVNKDEPRLTRREGGDPGPGQPMSGALSSWTPGQVHTPDYSGYDRHVV
jgi:hypothetical protein